MGWRRPVHLSPPWLGSELNLASAKQLPQSCRGHWEARPGWEAKALPRGTQWHPTSLGMDSVPLSPKCLSDLSPHAFPVESDDDPSGTCYSPNYSCCSQHEPCGLTLILCYPNSLALTTTSLLFNLCLLQHLAQVPSFMKPFKLPQG